MSVHKFIQNALSEWMNGGGPESDIVISSRCRIARNLSKHPFPMLSTNDQSAEVLHNVQRVLQREDFSFAGRLEVLTLSEMNELEKRVFVEKHLISPNLASESRNGAVALSENEAVSIMVNEEDHLRIQCLFPGFQVKEAWELANRIDDVFEASLDYAYDEKKGYLSACPTNVGTGIRASVMLHLPALVLTQQMNRILQAISQVGLVVRGIYGEGSEALGNLFQLSNQITLGQSEEEIIDNLYGVVKQVVDRERTARKKLAAESSARILDRVSRSYGILSHAHSMDSKEAAQRLSDVRLGIDLGYIEGVPANVFNELVIMTQPGFIQQYTQEKLTAEERDVRRAEMIRERLSSAS